MSYAYQDFDVQLTIIVNIPVVAQNPDFTTFDAKEYAFAQVADAIENYTHGNVSLFEAKVR